MIISLDYIVALPILLVAFYILIYGFYSSQALLSNLLDHQIKFIRLHDASQSLIYSLQKIPFKNSTELLSYYSKINNLSFSLQKIGNYSKCSSKYCRMVAVQNSSYLLVIGNESTN